MNQCRLGLKKKNKKYVTCISTRYALGRKFYMHTKTAKIKILNSFNEINYSNG